MARSSKLYISVQAGRNVTTISYHTSGVYRRLTVGDIRDVLGGQPVFASTGSKAFWQAIIGVVTADIAAGNGGGT